MKELKVYYSGLLITSVREFAITFFIKKIIFMFPWKLKKKNHYKLLPPQNQKNLSQICSKSIFINIYYVNAFYPKITIICNTYS